MSEKLVVYGFGSYFSGCAQYGDVDILIVHRSVDHESCRFAIRCKRFLASNLAKTDIRMLSESEEQQFSFVAKSSARQIGKVHEVSEEKDLLWILKKIGQLESRDWQVI